MDQLKEKFTQWTEFTATRETERERLANPEGVTELKQQISDKKTEVLRAQAELQMLQAQLVLSNGGQPTYRKATFEHDWAQRKATLKREVEELVAEQLEIGVSIPKLMKELGSRNPTWFYTVRESMDLYRGASKEEMAHTDWHHSDVTSVHRYGLGHGETGSDWGFVLLHGALESEYEGEQCMFDYETGNFIAGHKPLFDDVTPSAKKQRSRMLADILDGVYTKKVRRDTNPYFHV